MNTVRDKLGAMVVGLYAWIVTVFFGAILLDIMYFRLLIKAPGISNSSRVFSAIADGFLCLGVVVILAAMGAVAISWKSQLARSLLIASLLMISLEFVTPVFFSRLIQEAQNLSISPWLRMALSGLASLLAFLGLHASCRQETKL